MAYTSYRRQVEQAMVQAGREGMAEMLEDFRQKIHRNITGRRSGPWRKVPGTKHRMYRVSRPSEYPAVMLADLSGPRGVQWDATVTRNAIEGRIGSPFKHGLWLEKRRGKGKRPWLSRSWREEKTDILRKLPEYVIRNMKGRT